MYIGILWYALGMRLGMRVFWYRHFWNLLPHDYCLSHAAYLHKLHTNKSPNEFALKAAIEKSVHFSCMSPYLRALHACDNASIWSDRPDRTRLTHSEWQKKKEKRRGLMVSQVKRLIGSHQGSRRLSHHYYGGIELNLFYVCIMELYHTMLLYL